jgi:hypothetical protein
MRLARLLFARGMARAANACMTAAEVAVRPLKKRHVMNATNAAPFEEAPRPPAFVGPVTWPELYSLENLISRVEQRQVAISAVAYPPLDHTRRGDCAQLSADQSAGLMFLLEQQRVDIEELNATFYAVIWNRAEEIGRHAAGAAA